MNSPDLAAKPGFRFTHPMRVRWAEVDMQGVVFNPNYLMYFDVGVTEYWRAVAGGDANLLSDVLAHVYAVKSTVEYRASARFDDEIEVRARMARLGRTSLVIAFEIVRGEEILITGENVYVHAHDGRSEPWPAHFIAHAEAYENGRPDPGR